MKRLFKFVMVSLALVVGLVGVMQLIPYGRAHSNPPVITEPAWDSPRTRELAVRACFDCHSNETKWPWYAHVAPMSWAMQIDVDSGREVMNFSEWNRSYDLATYAGRRAREGMMPPMKYLMAHPEAKLTEAERLELARGLDATIRMSQAQR